MLTLVDQPTNDQPYVALTGTFDKPDTLVNVLAVPYVKSSVPIDVLPVLNVTVQAFAVEQLGDVLDAVAAVPSNVPLAAPPLLYPEEHV